MQIEFLYAQLFEIEFNKIPIADGVRDAIGVFEMIQAERVKNQFRENGNQSPEEIISKLKNKNADWVRDKDPDGDVTFVVIKVK